MKTQFPFQFNSLKILLDNLNARELNCSQINFRIYDEMVDVPISHFFSDPLLMKDEFICWGEKIADNLVLSWLVDGKKLDNAPIAMIDSEQSPVSVVAKTPEDFLQLLPYGTSMIGSIAENCLTEWADDEYTDTFFESYLTTEVDKANNKDDFAVIEYLKTAEMYGNLYELERPKDEIRKELEQEGKAFLELMNWYNVNGIEIAKNPYRLIKAAAEMYPSFFDRAIALGLPFQR